MGAWRPGIALLIAAWLSAIIITSMDVAGLPESLREAWRVITGA